MEASANASPITSVGTGWPAPRARQKRSQQSAAGGRRCGGASICAAPDRPTIRSSRLDRRRDDRRLNRPELVGESMVPCHCDCAGPNATRIVSSRSNRIARGKLMYAIIACPRSSSSLQQGLAVQGERLRDRAGEIDRVDYSQSFPRITRKRYGPSPQKRLPNSTRRSHCRLTRSSSVPGFGTCGLEDGIAGWERLG
jgi:hypothetical protein